MPHMGYLGIFVVTAFLSIELSDGSTATLNLISAGLIFYGLVLF